MKLRVSLLAATIALVSGCALGPDYVRPNLDVPGDYRGTLNADTARTLADLDWADLFDDAEMAVVVRSAVERNLDLKIALWRIEAARAQLTSTRSLLFPGVSGSLATTPSATSSDNDSAYSLGLLFSWEIDVFGKLRRANEASRAELLASEDGARAVMSSLVATTAGIWLSLRELDQEVAITRTNILDQERSLELVRQLMRGGVANGADEQQAITQLASTRSRLPQLQQRVIATENALSLLLGAYPSSIQRVDEAVLPQVPVFPALGLPSELLDRRPDVRASEQTLHAATARIGVAIANRFPVPTIGLGGFLGRLGIDLGDVFDNSGSTADVWSWGPNVDMPLIDWGRGSAGVSGARAQAEAAVLSYRSTVLNAMREVSDSLAAAELGGEVVEQAAVSASAAAESLRLQNMRYKAGVVGYLDVLDAQRQQYSAQLELARARLQHLQAYVDLYRALGGGWSDATLAGVPRVAPNPVIEPASKVLPVAAPETPIQP
ncbi:efflux transporter outer membrane subunit [Dokdonella sp.]|uniref:efflux transporter outer membrane subunit n=1 Tax=Dokdonella sp. TaxID=2291710 RepID=UPI003C500B6B